MAKIKNTAKQAEYIFRFTDTVPETLILTLLNSLTTSPIFRVIINIELSICSLLIPFD